MKKLVVVTLAVLAPGVALATDVAPRFTRPAAAPTPATVPLIQPEPAAAQRGNWTGFYFGGHGGYAWAKSSFTHLEGTNTAGESFTNSPNKMIFGGQLGARYQVVNNWVVGLEAAYDFRKQDAKTRTDLDANPRYRLSRLGNVWSLSGTGGYAFGDYLVYGKAGYARTSLNYENILIASGAVLGQSKANVGGYVLGAGVEYALTQNIGIGLEYSFHKFKVGDQLQLTTSGMPAGAINVKNDLTTNSGKVKANYRF